MGFPNGNSKQTHTQMIAKIVQYALALLICSLAHSLAAAQHTEGVFSIALQAGANHVSITNLKQTFCADENQPVYEINEKKHIAPVIAIGSQYRFPISLVAVEGSISYCQTRSEIEKNTIRNTETYDLKINHIMLGVGAKVYPVKGAYAKASMEAGPCLNSTSCVKYDATNMTNTAKMQVAEHISQTAKGQMLVRANIALGYDFSTGLTLETFYGKCLVDLIEVNINNYGFTEQRNESQYIGMSVGWMITKNGFSRKK